MEHVTLFLVMANASREDVAARLEEIAQSIRTRGGVSGGQSNKYIWSSSWQSPVGESDADFLYRQSELIEETL